MSSELEKLKSYIEKEMKSCHMAREKAKGDNRLFWHSQVVLCKRFLDYIASLGVTK